MNVKNKILTGILISTPLIFSGCYEIQNSENSNSSTTIVKKSDDFSTSIEKFEGNANSVEEYMLLAAAYMSRSGLSLDEVIQTICNSSTDSNSPFMAFIDSVEFATQGCSTALADVNKATDYHMLVIGDKCENPSLLNDFEKDVCLYKGLAQTMEVANTINYISNNISNSDEIIDHRLKASSCAMQYAFNGVTDDDCYVTEVNGVTFSQSDKEYDRIAVYTNSEEFEYLLTQNSNGSREVVVTDGFCTLNDFTSRDDYSTANEKYYACPITTDENENEITTTESLVNSFNEGTATIIAVGDNHSELVITINLFKKEISSSNGDNSDKDIIDVNDMVNYLNIQNETKYSN